MQTLLQQKTWRFIDQSMSFNRTPLESFAMDDTLCHLVGQGLSFPVVRTWVHHPYVVLGIQDHRMPYIQEGIEGLKKHIMKRLSEIPVVLQLYLIEAY